MHMADALLSPAVGGVMWAASAGAVAHASRRVERELDDRKVPLMGVLGAFLFAAQMINFSLPGTGSSGHLGGGLLLAILLGPSAAFLTVASVLLVQALFFADGGLLALGCNIFNLGFIPAFIAYPFIYRRMVGDNFNGVRTVSGTVFSAVVALQLGAFAVVSETALSGISSLPFSGFLLLMQPIHLLIGLVEGLVTVGIISFIRKARPDILAASPAVPVARKSLRPLLAGVAVCAVFTAGVLSSFASKNPDGLEWAVGKVTGAAQPQGPQSRVHRMVATLQQKSAIFPDYGPRPADAAGGDLRALSGRAPINPGTTVAGIIGTAATLALVLLVTFVLKMRKR